MKQPAQTAVLMLVTLLAGGSTLAAQPLSFQYGVIPFGRSENYILSRSENADVDTSPSPTAQFLSSDVIIREDPENPVYRFFDGGILKTVSWGDAYVDLYSDIVKRIDINLPGESRAKLYFFDGKLFLLHKASRLENRYEEAFSALLPALTDRIGSEPYVGETRFRGFSYELYAEYAFWKGEDVSIFVKGQHRRICVYRHRTLGGVQKHSPRR